MLRKCWEKTKRVGAWLTSFSACAPFLLVPLACGLILLNTGSDLWQWYRMQDWVEAPASVLDATLITHEPQNSDDARTYSVQVRYRYEYGGVAYEGKRLGIRDSTDNLGAYHSRWSQRLSMAKNQGRTVPCYVNPAKPEQAVLDRTLRGTVLVFGLLILLTFGGAGGWIFLKGGGLEDPARRLREPGTYAADKPWLAREDWRAGEVRGAGRTRVILLGIAASLWNAIAGVTFFVVISGMIHLRWRWPQGDEWISAVLSSLAVLPGLALAYFALREGDRYLRLGPAVFRMNPFPGGVGGIVGGQIELPQKMKDRSKLRMELVCVRIDRKTTSEGGESIEKTTLWSKTGFSTRDLATLDPHRSVYPLRFHVPADCYATRLARPEACEVEWTLKVCIPGWSFNESFTVPVSAQRVETFPQPDSVQERQEEQDVVAQKKPVEQRHQVASRDLQNEKIVIERAAEVLRVRFLKEEQNPRTGLLLMICLIGGFFGILAVCLTPVILVIPVALGLFGFRGILKVLKMMTCCQILEIHKTGLTLQGYCSFRKKCIRLERNQIRNIEIRDNAPQPPDMRECRILIWYAGDAVHCASGKIRNRQVAEYIGDLMRSNGGL